MARYSQKAPPNRALSKKKKIRMPSRPDTGYDSMKENQGMSADKRRNTKRTQAYARGKVKNW